MAGESDPGEQLVAFAAAYVEFSARHKALFDITFGAALTKEKYPDLAKAGDRVLALLSQPAARLAADADSAVDLIHAVGAMAHGYAAFLAEGIFGDPAEALEPAKEGARRAARKLIAA
jgi:hypothetical protein